MADSEVPVAGGNLLEARDLWRSYQRGSETIHALAGVTLSLKPGEIVAVVGRSGSGKTTLLNQIGCLDRLTSGSLKIAGTEVTALKEQELVRFRRDHIGFIFQLFYLIPTLTVEENLLLPLELNGPIGRAERERARALLEEVELADRAASFPDRLSGGEQQRVAVARALVHAPALMLADEPTGNLDLETGRKVLDLLDRLTRREGRTMLMVTHSPEVVGLADRVFAIEGGKLVERAP